MNDGERIVIPGDVEVIIEPGRQLTHNETRILEGLLRATIRLAGRCREIEASINRINSENKTCEHCGKVAHLWVAIEPDWKALKSSFRGLAENGTAIRLSANLLEIVKD